MSNYAQELVDVMNSASEEALKAEAKKNLKITYKLEEMAKKYLKLNEKKKAIEKEMEDMKAVFKDNGSFETNDIKVKVSYGSHGHRVKPLADFIKAGFTEKLLSEKNLITGYYTGDRVTVTDRTKKK